MNGDIEFGFRRIDSSCCYANLCHLLRPLPCEANQVFRQPSGSDEGAGAISLQGSQMRLRAGYDPIASGLSRIAVRGRPFLSERTDHNGFCYYKGGLAEGVTRRTATLNRSTDSHAFPFD